MKNQKIKQPKMPDEMSDDEAMFLVFGGLILMFIEEILKGTKVGSIEPGKLVYISEEQKYESVVELLSLGAVVFCTDGTRTGFKTVEDPNEWKPKPDIKKIWGGRYYEVKAKIAERKLSKEGE